MRVAHTLPTTWRRRNLTEASRQLELHAMAVATVRRVTEGTEQVFDRLREVSSAILVRIHKARSETQAPSALERVWEEMIALHLAGVPSHQLRLYVIETLHLLETLEQQGEPVTPQQVLAALHQANLAQMLEATAESQLLTAGDRGLSIGDVDRLVDATKSELAAKKVQLERLTQLQRQQRRERRGLSVVRGRA